MGTLEDTNSLAFCRAVVFNVGETALQGAILCVKGAVL